MAKGNLFLGTARRSVGDVVMYRREGNQVARVRVRKISNPRTDAQSAQRSFFSPVAKFYAPLAGVLDRSYEGKNKSQSYSAFLRDNVKLARKNGWLLPKGTGFFPLPYQLSNGTLKPVGTEYSYDSGDLLLSLSSTEGYDFTKVADISRAFVSKGYKDGDIFTFIIVKRDTAGNYVPLSMQFKVDTLSTENVAAAYPSLVVTPPAADETDLYVGFHLEELPAGACIYARPENGVWRRSKQFLAVEYAIMEEISSDAFKAAAVASYGNAATGDNPLVYLDGDELNQ